MTDLEQRFYNSCVPLDYPCTVGDQLIDPCNCQNFYLCEHRTSFVLQSCSDGTLFNHESETCELDEDVTIINKLCKRFEPWVRCDTDDDADIPALKERCTGIAPTPAPTTPAPPPGETGDNTGAIVGAIIAVLLIIAIVVVVIFIYKRRGKPMSHYMSYFRPKKNVSNPEYDNKEETYSEIKDVMGAPVYNDTMKGGNPGLPDRPSFTQTPTLKVNQGSNRGHHHQPEEVAYDNPGYTPSADDNDVIRGSASLNVSQSSLQPPSFRHIQRDEDRESTYSDLDQSSVEVPMSKHYTPLSVYTRGPNPRAAEEGAVQEYEVPRPTPEYYELQPDSNCVS